VIVSCESRNLAPAKFFYQNDIFYENNTFAGLALPFLISRLTRNMAGNENDFSADATLTLMVIVDFTSRSLYKGMLPLIDWLLSDPWKKTARLQIEMANVKL